MKEFNGINPLQTPFKKPKKEDGSVNGLGAIPSGSLVRPSPAARKRSRASKVIKEWNDILVEEDAQTLMDKIKELRIKRDGYESDFVGSQQAGKDDEVKRHQSQIDAVNTEIINLKKQVNKIKPGHYADDGDAYSR